MTNKTYPLRAIILLCISLIIITSGVLWYVGRTTEFPSTPQIIKWHPWSSTIFKEANKEHRQILLLGKSKWCHWCQEMEKTTFQSNDVIKYINATYFPVEIDVSDNMAVFDQYNISDLPTIIVLSPSNVIIKSMSGFMSPEDLLKKLQNTSH